MIKGVIPFIANLLVFPIVVLATPYPRSELPRRSRRVVPPDY